MRPVRFAGDDGLYSGIYLRQCQRSGQKQTLVSIVEADARSIRDVLSSAGYGRRRPIIAETKRIYYLSMEFLMGRS